MNKMILIFLTIILALTMTACGSQSSEESTQKTTNDLKKEVQEAIEEAETTTEKNKIGQSQKILIAYFTWADNTQVDNPEEVDTDASTSASVLAPGNAAMMAQWIQEEVGGDLFSIQVKEPYSSDYDECLNRAADEKAEDDRPELKTQIENIDSYDTIFLGFPNWWYTIPMAVHSFIDSYDFGGKIIIPFVTHGTGGLANCITDLKGALPDSTKVLEPVGIYRDDVSSGQSTIREWIQGLDIDFSDKKQNETQTDKASSEEKIKISTDKGNIVVQLEDNSATKDLLGRLPLMLQFENYNGTEKIAYLDTQLDTSDAPDKCTPKSGDLAYYAPWGNLAFFYQDFRESPELVPLGKIIEGKEYLDNIEQSNSVTIEQY